MTLSIDTLVIVNLAGEQTAELTRRLVENKFYFTRVESGGGFLGFATSTLLVGIEFSRYEALMKIIRVCCRRRRTYIPARAEGGIMQTQPLMIEAEVGGATVYALDVEQFLQI